VPLLTHHFGGEVLWCSCYCLSLLSLLDELSQSVIGKSNIPSLIHEYVLWLEVPVDDVQLVEVLQCEEYLSPVEQGHGLIEPPDPLKVRIEFSTSVYCIRYNILLHELHHEEDALLCLEGKL
jgi:hypothetical protein